MAQVKQHIAMANKHQEALTYLLQVGDDHAAWVTVVAFYKALQVVDACLVKTSNVAPVSHGERMHCLRAAKKFDAIYTHFHALKNASEIARYLTSARGAKYAKFEDYLGPGEAESQMVRHRLAQVEKSARKILDKAAEALAPAVPRAAKPKT